MKHLACVVSWLFCAALPVLAQGAQMQVPAGREVAQFKVLSPGLADRWELQLEADEFVNCTVETSEFDSVLELVDADGAKLAEHDGDGSRSELRWFAPRRGTYTFVVRGFDGRGGGSYRFSLLRYRTERLAADAVAEHEFGPEQWWHYRVAAKRGDVLVPRVLFGGTLTAVLDLEQRRLPEWHGGYTATGDGDVLLRVEGGPSHRCRVEVQCARQSELRPDGALDDEIRAGGMHVVRHEFAVGAWALELDMPQHDLAIDLRELEPVKRPRFVWTGTQQKNGRYRRWLLVREPMHAELVLRNHNGPAACRGRFVPVGDDVEFGRKIESTLPLGGGRVFRVTAPPGRLLRMRVESSAFDVSVDLWAPNGEVLSFDDRARLDTDSEQTHLVRQHGVHHLTVFAHAGAGGGAFSLCVDDVPIPDLTLGAPVPVRLGAGDAFAHLALAHGQQLWLSVESPDFDPALVVFDPDGEQVATFEGGGVGWNVLNGFEARKPGVHTLQVVSRNKRGAGVLRAIQP